MAGDGTEQWYRSDFEFDFEIGQTYEVLFFLEAPDEAQFRRKTDEYTGYDVPPYLIDVESRSRDGHDDGPTTTYNTWPPFMRIVLDAPDADGDGVADPDDACPRAPGAPDADGDGCTDPPPDPTGDDDGGTGTDAGSTGEDGGGDDTGATPTTAGADDDEGEDGGDADTGTGGAPVSDGGSPRGCSVGHGSPVLALWVLLGARRRRRATAARRSER